MSSTYLALCQKLRQEVGIAGTGPASVLNQTGMMAKIVAWIADADVTIQGKWLDWGFLWKQFSHNTIAATKDVSAPNDLGEWDENSFWIGHATTSARKLKKMEYDHWRDTNAAAESSNVPAHFIVRPDHDIILHPAPDAIYVLTADYWRCATRMTANTDTSPIPSRFDRLIIAQAKIFYAEHENAPEVMQAAMAEYAEMMHRLESLYLPGQKPRTKAHSDYLVTVPE